MPNIVIVGGGASGLLSSIFLKKSLKDQYDVIVLERLERVGKKLLATGGGKANITNSNILKSHKDLPYNHPDFVLKQIAKFSYLDTIKCFQELGLFTIELQEGRIYPKSESANSLLDVLRNQMNDLGVIEKCNFEVKKISIENNHYVIESTRNTKITAEYVILACGGKSSPILGSNGTGYDILKKLKVDITPISPSLTGIRTEDALIKGLEGIRAKAKVSLFVKKEETPYFEEYGEVQFKQNYLSGIVIMNLASKIAFIMNHKNAQINYFSLDLMPEYSKEELKDLLLQRYINLKNYSNANFLIGMFSKMLANNILRRAKIDLAGYVENLNQKDLEKIVNAIKSFDLSFKDFDSFDHSHATAGGVNLSEVNDNLELLKYPKMYVVGELLDIDGACGGYNLQWAWTSAYVASQAIIESNRKRK